MGSKSVNFNNYKSFVNKREINDKTCGGLICWVKKDINCYKWVNGESEIIKLDNSNLNASSEIMWVVFQLKGGMKLAEGIIYMNPENSGNEELVLEGKILKNKGMNILVIGDFNVHIGEDMLKGGGILNNNGKHFIEISNSFKLSVANCCNVCKGSWTWDRGTERSITDS